MTEFPALTQHTVKGKVEASSGIRTVALLNGSGIISGLRRAIGRGEPLAWHRSGHPDYTAFKGLQTLVAELLTQSSENRPAPADAARNFAHVTSNEYEQTFPDVALEADVYYPDGHDATELNRPLRRLR
jgi:hypothetical protein